VDAGRTNGSGRGSEEKRGRYAVGKPISSQMGLERANRRLKGGENGPHRAHRRKGEGNLAYSKSGLR